MLNVAFRGTNHNGARKPRGRIEPICRNGLAGTIEIVPAIR